MGYIYIVSSPAQTKAWHDISRSQPTLVAIALLHKLLFSKFFDWIGEARTNEFPHLFDGKNPV